MCTRTRAVLPALLVTLCTAMMHPVCAHGRGLMRGRALEQVGGGSRPGGNVAGGGDALAPAPASALNATVTEQLLLDFKNSFDNSDQVLTNWRPGSDICAWEGISCDAQGQVVSIVLLNKGLVGTIPAPRGWVLPSTIKDISLGNIEDNNSNKISGPIPPGWKLPAELELMFLGLNPLGGSLSADWQLPRGLVYFLMEACNLTGTLPNGWDLPPTIQSVNLVGNQLQGSIPLEFTTIPSMAVMSLQDNQLTGTIPAKFTFNASFAVNGLSLSGNNMSGAVPSWPDYPAAIVSIFPGNRGLCSNDTKVPTAPSYTRASTTSATNTAITELPLCPGAPQPVGSTGLSDGAIAGIAVGSVAAVAAVLGVALVLRQRQRRRQAAAVAGSDMMDGSKVTPSTIKLTPVSSTFPPSSGSNPLNPFAAGPSDSSSNSLPLTALHSSGETASPVEQARLQAKLDALERDAPSWLISPDRITLDQGAGGKLVLLGSGAYGRVYKGVLHPAAGAGTGPPLPVAIKVMEGGQVNAFLKEASVMQQLNGGPHTVHLHGACVSEQQLIVVMELLEGGDLRAALSSDSPPLWLSGGKQIALDIAAGLTWLHSQNVTHRDLKSKNVLLTAERRAKISDVGTAALHSATYLSAGSSNFGGTLAWAAPEMLLGAPCTHRVDMYSLGVVLWEIVTGANPRRGDAVPPPASDACPQELSDLISECLSTEPAQRPTAQQALERLQQL